MLGVRLGEHGELGVGRLAADGAIGALEILDLVLAEREAQPGVGLRQLAERNRLQRPRRHMLEELRRLIERAEDRFGHAVVQPRRDAGIGRIDVEGSAALDALHRAETAVAGDVGRLGRPGRDGAQARDDEIQGAAHLRSAIAIVQQALEQRALPGGELAFQLDEMPIFGADGTDSRIDLLQRGDQLGEAELRSRARPAELEGLGH